MEAQAQHAEKLAEDMNVKLVLYEESMEDENQQHLEGEFEDGEEDEEEDEDDFTFVCCNPDEESTISADDAFHNGQIRPMYPLFNQELLFSEDSTPSENDLPSRPMYPLFNRDLLLSEDSTPSKKDLPSRPPVKKVFVEERDPPPRSPSAASGAEETEGLASGQYCAWSKKAVEASSSSEACKKCNSTGFSKVWRFRDLVHRSNSDGRDAFVFLNGSATSGAKRVDKKSSGAGGRVVEKKGTKEGGKVETTSSVHQLQYMKNRAVKNEGRRRSYLPYRPDLVGFFTNVNGGLSRNVHPF